MDNRREIVQLCRILAFINQKDIENLGEEMENGEIDWVGLVAVANMNLLTPALYSALREKGLLEKIGDPLLPEFLKEIYRSNETRNFGIVDQLLDIQSILNEEEIVPLVLKGGSALTEKLYPAIGIRTMNDIDFMMNPSEFERGLKCLEMHGYVEFGRDLKRWHHHTPRMNKKGYPAAIEPHFRVLYNRDIEYIPYDETTSQPSENPLFRGSQVLKPTWHLYHIFLHSAVIDKNHQRWKLGLRYLYDFAVVAEKYGDAIDWEMLYRMAERYHHEKILEDFLYLTAKLFNLETPIHSNPVRGAIFLKKCLWESTLVPDTRIFKFYQAFTDFHEIYGYEKLKNYYGLRSKVQYPLALMKYMFYHGRKHLFH